MKRVHLFEFEDQSWFPDWIRKYMTRYIATLHRLFGTSGLIASTLNPLIKKYDIRTILDLCSGSGGPMIDAIQILKKDFNHQDLHLTMSDLYPNQEVAEHYNSKANSNISYHNFPVNAAEHPFSDTNMTTMICSFHHMEPETARSILQNASNSKKPFFLFELSNNSTPHIITLLVGLPVTFFMVLIFTPFVRPLSITQIIFTYLIPILPIFIAWDGTVSNMRTYTIKDLEELLEQVDSPHYNWETDTIKTKSGKMLFLTGKPA